MAVLAVPVLVLVVPVVPVVVLVAPVLVLVVPVVALVPKVQSLVLADLGLDLLVTLVAPILDDPGAVSVSLSPTKVDLEGVDPGKVDPDKVDPGGEALVLAVTLEAATHLIR